MSDQHLICVLEVAADLESIGRVDSLLESVVSRLSMEKKVLRRPVTGWHSIGSFERFGEEPRPLLSEGAMDENLRSVSRS